MRNFIHFPGSFCVRSLPLIIGILVLFTTITIADEHKYTDSWGKAGYTIEQQSATKTIVNYSIETFELSDFEVNGKSMQNIELSGHFLPNDEGAPNLLGSGRYIAIPQGATATVNVLSYRTETFTNVDIAPAFRIPWVTENGPLEYNKNESIYSANKFYPEEPVLISSEEKIRGIDVVMLGITPFHYNPVTKQLIVYRDLKVEISFEGGNGHFGEDRLRSRWWDPLLADMLLNYESLPKIDYNKSYQATDDIGAEYLIISPDGVEFQQWADSIKNFRTLQGIKTEVVTLSEIGGNNAALIENYINDAYNTWDIPPAAILLFGDYGTDPTNSVIAPIYDSYCVSDNIYADINEDQMPDIIAARMTANNATELQTMVTKFINYETAPPTNPDFYNNPMTCLGYQTERWFQICTESVAGFWEQELGKTTNRVNAINNGSPTTGPWSTAENTEIVLNIFGPDGLGYIPATPGEVDCTWDGTGNTVVEGINNGAFMLLHRDHGSETLWGDPDFTNNHINSLNNTDLTYIWSVNCLTGKYNYSGECMVEKLHRHTSEGYNSGALGVIGDSEVSYSFVNDTYVWGAFDNMWPDFMPDYGTNPPSRDLMPGFANAAGKYFLQQSSWPYNTDNKEVTYHLFHHHGDAFLNVYSEIPQELTITHNPILYAGVDSFDVTANAGAFIALTVNGEIIGTATATGEPVSIDIPAQFPPDTMKIVITKQNFYRYENIIEILPQGGSYVVRESYTINDISNGNGDGLMDYGETNLLSLTVKNVGIEQANNVIITLSSEDEYISFTDDTEDYGSIAGGATSEITDGFAYNVNNDIPDEFDVSFEVSATDGSEIWISHFSIEAHAPIIEFVDFIIEDPAGNNNGKIDPGETVNVIVNIENTGSSEARDILGELSTTDMYLTINPGEINFGNLEGDATTNGTFNITTDVDTPLGHLAEISFFMEAELGIEGSGSFDVVIGQIPILILDFDENANSATIMENAINNMDIVYEKLTSFPPDLNLYSTIFLCLGVFPDNYQLSSSEGQLLATYLNNGGNLYMEGGDTWFYDDSTAVHGMFNILGLVDGSSDMDNVVGQIGTFTEDMSFEYSGDNSWMDHIEPISPAFNIFNNLSPQYCTGVAFDAGSYRTIGVSHEFGGLDDATSPSTKEELMIAYLDFLGNLMSLQAAFVSNTTIACTEDIVEFQNQSTGVIISWEWTFEGGTPPTSDSQNPMILYFNAGTFDVSLTVSDGEETSTITLEDYISVSAVPAQAAIPDGDDEICTNFIMSSEYSTEEIETADSYQWQLLPFEAGIITGLGSTATVVWTESWEGNVTIKVKGLNNCGEGIFSEEYPVLCSICTGVEEISENTRVQVYPNPNTGKFTVKLNLNSNSGANLKIYNALNEIVYEDNHIFTKSKYSKVIDLGNYSSGIYYLKISANDTSWVKKIILQN